MTPYSDEDVSAGGLRQISGKRAGRDIALQLLSKGANVALGTAVTVVLVRGLGDRGFGQWSTIAAVVQLVGFLGDLGLEQITVRKAAEEPSREDRWVGALLTLRLAIAIPTTIASMILLLALSTDDHMRWAAIIQAATLLLAPLTSTRVIFQLRVRNTTNASLELANGILWGAAVFSLAAMSAGLVAYALAFAGALVVTSIAQAVLALRVSRPRIRTSREFWPQLVRVGLPVAISSLLVMAYARIDQVLVFEINGERAAGLYGAAYRILERGHLLPGAVMGTLFPLIAAARGVDPDRMRRLVQTAFEVLLTVALPIFAFTLVAATPLVDLLFGADFRAASTAMTVLMGSFVVVAIGYLCGYLVIIFSLQWRFLRYALAGLVFNVVANLALLPRYGFEAAAWTTLATELLVVGLSFRAVTGAIDHPLSFDRPARIAGAAAIMAAAVWAAGRAGGPVGVLIATGAVAYPLALLALRGVDSDQLRRLVER